MDQVILTGQDGQFALTGVLSFQTVPAVWRQGLSMFNGEDAVHLDLKGVSRSDSAGLVLLIEWMRHLRLQSREISFTNVPRQMLAIARVSSLDKQLPLSRDQSS
ncbi:MAG: STAS domain-containing protein [Gammaproteobacteria bacterium]|nr:MAG: STAS domain-containing protein [Gammaproteobacteria bacterium]